MSLLNYNAFKKTTPLGVDELKSLKMIHPAKLDAFQRTTALAVGIYRLLILVLIWPVINLLIFFLRFQSLSLDIINESIVFLPLGILSGLLFNFLNLKSKTDSQRRAILIGYIIMFPIAFIAALFSGLVLPPIIGVTIYGIIPLAIGMTLGYLLKRPKPTAE